MPEARTYTESVAQGTTVATEPEILSKYPESPKIVNESSHILSGPDLGCLVSLVSAVTTIFDLNYLREAPLDCYRLIEYLAKHLECSRLTHTNTDTKFSERREPHT